MIPYLLDFHENIRLSKTLNEYQEQSHPIEKATILFLNPPKKSVITFVRIFMEQSGNVPIFSIPGTLFRNIHRNFIGNFLRIYSRECSSNLSRTYICLAGKLILSGIYSTQVFVNIEICINRCKRQAV